MLLTSFSTTQLGLEWLYCLTKLQHLHLDVRHTFELSGHLTQLTELSNLRLNAAAAGSHKCLTALIGKQCKL